jgi:uncharacterized surface protein with fasciclin (FAS1) repeats
MKPSPSSPRELSKTCSPENKAAAAIPTYHVIAGEVMASAVVTMDGKSAATVNGKSVGVSAVELAPLIVPRL